MAEAKGLALRELHLTQEALSSALPELLSGNSPRIRVCRSVFLRHRGVGTQNESSFLRHDVSQEQGQRATPVRAAIR